MSKRLNAVTGLLAMALASGSASASLVEWDLTGAIGTEATRSVASTADNVSGLDLIRGAGLTAASGANSLNASGWTNEATDYFSFGFTVASGYAVNLSDLKIGTRSSAYGPGTVGLYYSTDGFSSSSLLYSFNQAPGANYLGSTVDLSALGSLTGTIEFRLMQIGTGAANGLTTTSAGTFRVGDYYDGATYSNLILDGSVVAPATVPIPGALWLMASGLGVVGALGRRRQE